MKTDKVNFLLFALCLIFLSVVNCAAQTTSIRINSKVPISAQFTKKNCLYEISERIDLNGKTVIVPEGSVLSFSGGYIENGCVDLNYAKIEGTGICCSIIHPAGNFITTSQCLMSEHSSEEYNTKMLQMLVDNGVTVIVDVTRLIFNKAIKVKESIRIEGSTPNRSVLLFPKSKGFVWNYHSSSHDNRVCNLSIESKGTCFDFYNDGGLRPINLYFSKFENIWAESKEGDCFSAGTNQGYQNSYGSMVFNTVFEDIMVNAPKGNGFVGINGNTIEFRSIKCGSCAESVFLNCGGIITAFNGTFGNTKTFYKADLTRNDNQPLRLKASFRSCNVEDFKGVLFDCAEQSGIYCHMSFEDCSFYVAPGKNGVIDYCPFRFFYLYNFLWRNCSVTYINNSDIDSKHALFEIVKPSETTFWTDRDISYISGKYRATIISSSKNTNSSVVAADYNHYLYNHLERERIDNLFTERITPIPIEVYIKDGTFPVDKGSFLLVKCEKDFVGGRIEVNYPTISPITSELATYCVIKNSSKYSNIVLKHNQEYNSRFWSETGDDIILKPGQISVCVIYCNPNTVGSNSLVSNVCYISPILKMHQNKGSSSNRPQLNKTDIGFQYYDTSLGKPIWWNGYNWTTSDGVRIN